ncbi:cobalt ABC transporter permease, partial [Afifella sp. IM 167]|nr:cobalt ABC transporter permease [Afifella sp. IM 167]
ARPAAATAAPVSEAGEAAAPDAPAANPAPEAIDMEALLDEQRRMVTEAVQKQVNPLRRDIEAYKEKRDLQSVLGGIGYILGIFGIGFYFAARRKMKAA